MPPLENTLNEQLPRLKSMLREAGYPSAEVAELVRLMSGLYVLMSFADEKNNIDRKKVNKAFHTHLGSGHSWYSALKFLSGARAKEIFSKRTDVIRELGGSELVHTFNVLLPQLSDQIHSL